MMHVVNFQELFSILQNMGEQTRIEAKETSRKLGKSALETISAFSNEPGLGGGYLILGLAKNNSCVAPYYYVTGIFDPENLQSEIATVCRQNFNIVIQPSIEVIDHPHGLILLVYIPEAESHQKPVYLLSEGTERGSFRRIGPTDQRCTPADLDVIYQSRSRKQFDETIVQGSSWEDFDPHAIAAYRSLREKVAAASPILSWNDEDLLVALGAVDDDNGSLKPTVAGLMLFGKEAALRHFFLKSRIDYIIVNGVEWIRDPDERYRSVVVYEPLLFAIPRIVELIMRDVPKLFHLPSGSLTRRDIPIIPEMLIREAVCNAVMHRDYSANQILQIIHYTNRIEFRNPGYSLKPIEQLGLPGSIPRNARIPTILHEVNLAEVKGSGIRIMQEAAKAANLTVPLFESNRATNSFTLTLLTHHFFDKRDLEWLAQFRECHLTDDEAKTLIAVREMGAISSDDYCTINDTDTLRASMHLNRLCELGLLKQKGRSTDRYYAPTHRLLNPGDAHA